MNPKSTNDESQAAPPSGPNSIIKYDIGSLRLLDSHALVSGGIKTPTKAIFGKLSKHRFSRTNPFDEYKFPALLVDDKEGREVYLAMPHLATYLGSMAKSVILRMVVDSAATPKLIAEPIIDAASRTTLWTTTMIEAIQLSEAAWVRIESNMDAQQYTIIQAANNLGDPQWPTQTLEALIHEVFLGRIIASEEHPLISQLQGKC